MGKFDVGVSRNISTLVCSGGSTRGSRQQEKNLTNSGTVPELDPSVSGILEPLLEAI